MEWLESIKGLDFQRFGLIGSVIGGLFYVIVKILTMFDRYNQRLLEIIDDEQDEIKPPRESWISKNRAEK